MAKQKRRKDGLLKKSFRVKGSDKRYYVYARDADGLRIAENIKREEIEKGLERVFNPTLFEYYEHFRQERERAVKEASLRTQQIVFNMIANTELVKGIKLGDMYIREITRRNITDARSILLNQGKKPEYLNIAFKHLNHVFNFAVSEDLIIKNPCQKLPALKRETETINETKHRSLTEEETIKFFNAARERNSFYINAFLFLINSGVRVGELGALTVKDIDTKSGYIHIKRTVTRDACGGYMLGSDTKTKNSKRDIPLSPELYKIICNQKEFNKMVFGLNINDITLFKTSEGKLLRAYSLNNEIERICKDANIMPFTCHCFRNTFATRFIEQRPQDFKILSEIMGHKDIKITLELYTHVMAEQKEKSMNSIAIKTS